MTGILVARFPDLGDLADTLLIASIAAVFALGIIRPIVIARWAKQAHPDLQEDHPSVLSTVRFIGIAGLSVMAVFFLAFVSSR